MAYVRKVRTASGAVAMQAVCKHRGEREILHAAKLPANSKVFDVDD